jgi:hypothetical protein
MTPRKLPTGEPVVRAAAGRARFYIDSYERGTLFYGTPDRVLVDGLRLTLEQARALEAAIEQEAAAAANDAEPVDSLSGEERVAPVPPLHPTLDPERLARALAKHRQDFIEQPESFETDEAVAANIAAAYESEGES